MAGNRTTAGGGLTSAGTDAGGFGGSSGNSTVAGTDAGAGAAALGGGAAGGTAGASAGATNAEPGVTKDAEAKLSSAGLSLVSYGAYINGESFQAEGVLTQNGYQYTAFWNTARHVVMARRALPAGAWASFEFSDYTNTEADAHNTISLGVTEADGTLHVAFDHHVSPLHYRKSITGLLTEPAKATWAASSFSAPTSNLAGADVKELTYPRFLSEPGGGATLFSARIGSSGSGDEYLWEYSAATHSWTSLGKYVDGIVDNINAYLHGLSYGRGSQRLHASWCWRDTSNAASNHDLLYVYSDDNGRTWRNNAGVSVGSSGTAAIKSASNGIKVWSIGQNRGLINSEHMAVDAVGRVHVLLSQMPDAEADDSNFDTARVKSQYFDYWRDEAGKWTRTALALPAVAGFRGKLAITGSNDVYAILPDLRIAATSAASGFKTWTLFEKGETGRFFSDPLIDTTRLLTEDKLTVVYTEQASPNIDVFDYTLE